MHTFYIDVPDEYELNWYLADDCSVILSKTFMCQIEFVLNCYGQVSRGDLYKVTVDNEGDELLFILKSGFATVDNKKVEAYLNEN